MKREKNVKLVLTIYMKTAQKRVIFWNIENTVLFYSSIPQMQNGNSMLS